MVKNLYLKICAVLFIIGMAVAYILPFDKKINLGLDLRGGMHVVLKAHLQQEGVADELKSSLAEVALEIIRNRIDGFGVKEPVIQIQGKDSLLVQLPGVVDRGRALDLIGQTGLLEFKLVTDNTEELQKLDTNALPPEYEILPMKDTSLVVYKKAEITGADVATASIMFDNMGLPAVSLKMKPEGAKKFAEVTRNNVGKRLAIVLDGKVKSAPAIREPIISGDAQITGDFTVDEAKDLSLVLRAGALPVSLTVEEERTVGPLLGEDSIKSGIKASLIGGGLVALFMIAYYWFAGLVAVFCLGLNLLFILAGLSLFKATLTLPGIAGMILTVGMAVDANILIYERIREELALKKPLSLAIKAGYSRAFSAIFDSNLTTLIAAFFLFMFGTGPIKGFAVTLTLGLVSSVFTAVFVSRLIYETLLAFKAIKGFHMLSLFSKPNYNFIGISKLCVTVSLILVVAGVGIYLNKGKEAYGVDFRGGEIQEYKFSEPVDIQRVRSLIDAAKIKDLTIQNFKNDPTVIILKSAEGISAEVQKVLKENFTGVELVNVEKVGPAVGKQLKMQAFQAIFFALLGILVYVGLRFKQFEFGLAGVIALFHDILIALGFSVFFGYTIDLLTVSAFLTIAGYSINDTIVIYDRIREIAPRLRKASLPEIINTALNQTLSRTIFTSFATILSVVALFFFGGDVLRGFSFALIVGFISGVYSTVYIASPLVIMLRKSPNV